MKTKIEKDAAFKVVSRQDEGNLMERTDPLDSDKTGIYYDHASVVEKNIRFKFDLQLDNMEEFGSIMEMVINKIPSLKQDRIVESCELHLFAVPPFGKNKIAKLSVSIDGNQFIGESRSPRWDNAFLNAFDNVCIKISS